MRFEKHSDLEGKHAFLSASKYHWIRYDPEKLDRVYEHRIDAVKGTQLHDLAKMLIQLKQPLPELQLTLNMYVNDAIGFRMIPEQVLMYSYNAFGTADAISFRQTPEGRQLLRIHDLKTGVTKASMEQLLIYAAFFCLEYGFKPVDIDIELRIYQNNDIDILEADPMDVTRIMSTIVTFDARIEEMKKEAFG